MPVTVSTDPQVIGAALDRLIAADPVRGTLLGTVRTSLRDTTWAALHEDGVAARSDAEYPVVLGGSWPDEPRRELIRLLPGVPRLKGVSGPADLVAEVVAALPSEARQHRMAQRLFQLAELDPPRVPGRAILAGEQHRALVHEWYLAFIAEAEPGVPSSTAVTIEGADRVLDDRCCWLWLDDDGVPVSMAARRPVLCGSARVGPVYTPVRARGLGYGAAATAAATRSILDDAAIPVLFTDLANPVSNKIYRRMGYQPVEDRLIVWFS
jgi:predicted GNAT family acetyltransferase